jgi:hypothetical protein
MKHLHETVKIKILRKMRRRERKRMSKKNFKSAVSVSAYGKMWPLF